MFVSKNITSAGGNAGVVGGYDGNRGGGMGRVIVGVGWDCWVIELLRLGGRFGGLFL